MTFNSKRCADTSTSVSLDSRAWSEPRHGRRLPDQHDLIEPRAVSDDRGRRVHRVGEQLWIAQDDIIRRDHLARARPECEDEAVVWLRPRLCGVGFLCDRAKRQRQREACRTGAERQCQRKARRAAQDRAPTDEARAGRTGAHDYAGTGSAGTSWSSQ